MLFDGGIRSGQDIMRAVALGARACLSGRAYVYGLGAGGQAGVARAIEIMRNELSVSMALTGVTSIKEIDRSVMLLTLDGRALILPCSRNPVRCRWRHNICTAGISPTW